MSSEPADDHVRRSVFETRDEGEITDFLRTQYIGNETRFGAVHGQARWRAATSTTPHIASDNIRSSIDYRGVSDPFDYFLFYVCRHGQMSVDGVDREQRLVPGDATFFSPGHPLNFDFQQMGIQVLRLAPGRMEEIAAELTGVAAAQVRFDGNEPISKAAHHRWKHTFLFISDMLDTQENVASSALVTAQLAELLAAVALETFPNSIMTVQRPGAGRVDPAALRRAVNHIDAHADQPLTLADIANAAGTTGRAIQYAFRKHRNTTPLGYLRSVRLDRAHRDLQHGDPTRGDTVAHIAARWGFANSGRFATEYRHAYGQPPSHTLRT